MKKKYIKIDPDLFKKFDFKIELPELSYIEACPVCRDYIKKELEKRLEERRRGKV